MAVTTYDERAGPAVNSSPCGHNMTSWEQNVETMYTYFYLLLFIPGLLLNATALWVLCRHIRYASEAAHKRPLSTAHTAACLSPVRTPKR